MTDRKQLLRDYFYSLNDLSKEVKEIQKEVASRFGITPSMIMHVLGSESKKSEIKIDPVKNEEYFRNVTIQGKKRKLVKIIED